MPVRIRLQRHGRKGKPFYWIVAADARSKRDGKLLEKIGTYNPTTNPATVNLDVDAAVKWLMNGAEPTNTAKALLSYKGAMLKKHLLVGVNKGALTLEQAEEKFKAWLEEKENKVLDKKKGLKSKAEAAKAEILAKEKAISEARAEANAPVEDEAPADSENASKEEE
ncbi:MAG TPA: 30S ribosomal protein S16 [Flavobacteriia bacterium]|nr:30S ribosomal protein S16 [Flavobacteriia bacterium]